jgi:hypothetical protein
MRSNWKNLAIGLLVVACVGCLSVADAFGQFLQQQPTKGTAQGRNPFGQPVQQRGRQPGTMQPGQMQQGTMTQQPGRGNPGTAAKSNETFAIVEVDKQLQIVPKPQGLNDLKKRLKEDYKAAKKAYDDAKKDKANKGVKLEEPKEKKLTIVKAEIKGQDKAQEELQKLQADRAKGGRKSSR